jgi:hypothetical protein
MILHSSWTMTSSVPNYSLTTVSNNLYYMCTFDFKQALTRRHLIEEEAYCHKKVFCLHQSEWPPRRCSLHNPFSKVFFAIHERVAIFSNDLAV